MASHMRGNNEKFQFSTTSMNFLFENYNKYWNSIFHSFSSKVVKMCEMLWYFPFPRYSMTSQVGENNEKLQFLTSSMNFLAKIALNIEIRYFIHFLEALLKFVKFCGIFHSRGILWSHIWKQIMKNLNFKPNKSY